MSVLIPEVLEIGKDLSPGVLVAALVVGLLLWLLGGYGHRFWTVLFTTVLAGIAGLYLGPQVGLQRLVGGLLVAVAAGALALSLVRLGMFLTVGLLAFAVMRRAAPAWDEPVVTFLVGGLVGVLLDRFWVTVFTSVAGTLIMAHAGLCLLGLLPELNVARWCARHAPVVNWAVGALAVLGILVQYLVQRRLTTKPKAKEGEEEEEDKKGKGKKDKKAA
jgi:hypothetical protein